MQEIVPIVVAFDNNYCIPRELIFHVSKRQTRERESKTLL
ncbi:hypothetical protein HpMMM59_00910 [Helicobacter pylori]